MYSKESMECLMKLASLIIRADQVLLDCKYIDTSAFRFPPEGELQRCIDRMYQCVRIYEKNMQAGYRRCKEKAYKEE